MEESCGFRLFSMNCFSMNSQLDEFCSSTQTNSQALYAKSILFRQSKLPEGLSALENNPHPCTRKAMTARIEALKVVPRNGYVHIVTSIHEMSSHGVHTPVSCRALLA